MKIFSYIFLFMSLALLVQCKSDPVSDWEEINLLEYGATVKIKAPKTVKVKAGKLMDIKDIVLIDSLSDYNLQIYVSDAMLGGIDQSLNSLKSDLKDEPYFGEIIEEFPQGFIFNTHLDSSTTSYDFRYLEKKGDKEIQFQMGIVGIHSLEMVEKVLAGIKQD